MAGSWPQVWEPQAVTGFPAKCGRSTTPSIGTKKILASLSAQQEKLRELESRLRLWPSRPKNAGSVAMFLEEVAARIDSLGQRLEAMDECRGRSPRRSYGSDIARLSDVRAPSVVASEPLDRPGLRTYPSWPEKAESAWRQLAASWQEMASRAELGGRSPRPSPHVAHVAHVAHAAHTRQEPSMGNTAMSASFAAVGQKAPQPRDVSFSYGHFPSAVGSSRREEPQRTSASGRSDALDEASRPSRVFQSTPSRPSRPSNWYQGYQGLREPVTMTGGTVPKPPKEHWRPDHLDLLEPNTALKPNVQTSGPNGSSGRRQGWILAEPEFDPNGNQWAK